MKATEFINRCKETNNEGQPACMSVNSVAEQGRQGTEQISPFLVCTHKLHTRAGTETNQNGGTETGKRESNLSAWKEKSVVHTHRIAQWPQPCTQVGGSGGQRSNDRQKKSQYQVGAYNEDVCMEAGVWQGEGTPSDRKGDIPLHTEYPTWELQTYGQAWRLARKTHSRESREEKHSRRQIECGRPHGECARKGEESKKGKLEVNSILHSL